jgi:hypothetical protein
MGSAGLSWVLPKATHNDGRDGDGGFDDVHGVGE